MPFEVGDEEVDPGIEHHYVADVRMQPEIGRQGTVDVIGVVRLDEHVVDPAVRVILHHVVQETGPAVDGRIRLAEPVPADAHDQDGGDVMPAGQLVRAKVTAFVQGHSEIGQVTVGVRFGVDETVGDSLLLKRFGQDLRLPLEHRGHHHAGGVGVQHPGRCLPEGFDVVLVVLEMDDVDPHRGDGFRGLGDSRGGQFPEGAVLAFGNQDGDEDFSAFREEGGEHIGLVTEFLNGLHDFCVTLLGYLAAVVQDAVHRAFGKAGAAGDVHDRDFLGCCHNRVSQCKSTKNKDSVQGFSENSCTVTEPLYVLSIKC